MQRPSRDAGAVSSAVHISTVHEEASQRRGLEREGAYTLGDECPISVLLVASFTTPAEQRERCL